MKREIKFRAFHINDKQMIDWSTISQSAWNNGLTRLMYDIISARNPDYEVMQFTGLTDKNGKEVYEGDIIKVNDYYDTYGMLAGEIYEIYFNSGGFRLKPKYTLNSNGNWVEDGNDIEVIGNIYETPELL